MSALSYNAQRRALLSSYSPNLSDPFQFPVAAILAKRPPLLPEPESASFDAPKQLGYPTPPISPTPDIAPRLVSNPDTQAPTVHGLGIDYGDHFPQAQDFDGLQAEAAIDLRPVSRSPTSGSEVQPGDDLPANNPDDDDEQGNQHGIPDTKKPNLVSRSIVRWMRFAKRD